MLAALFMVVSACGGGDDSATASADTQETTEALRAPRNLWQPPSGATPTSGNYIYLQSDAGDYVGGGGTHLYTQANALLTLSSSGIGAQVQVQGDQQWSGHYQLPASLRTLKVGYYDSVLPWPSQDTRRASLAWFGEGRSCSTMTGWLAVDRVVYSGTTLTALDLRFEQRCNGGTAALRGKMRWSASDTTTPPGPVNPPPAELWRAPAAAVPASGNYVYLQGEAGDYIVGNTSHLYTGLNALFSTVATNGRVELQVTGNENWRGSFQAMNTLSTLQPGYYPNLKRYPFHNPTRGGLDWSGEGRGCNTLTGWFAVDQVVYVNGALDSIELRFEQHCEGGTPALRGQLRWSVRDTTQPGGPIQPPPADLWRPAAGATPASGNFVYLQSDAGDYIGGGATTLYTPTNAVIRTSTSDGLVSVQVGGNSSWTGEFRAMTGLTQLQPGYYGNLQRYPFHNPAFGGLNWSGDGRGCNTLTGWFVVDSVTYTAGVLTAIDLRFEQHCEGATPALRGRVRWSSSDTTQPGGPTTPPAGLWQPPVGATPASGNYVYLQSDAGDYIGGGTTSLVTPASMSFSATTTNAGYFGLYLSSSNGWWYGDFKAMNSLTQLQPGYYGNLQRYPFHNTVFGGLNWSGMGRGCNTLTGWFNVDSVTYMGGAISAIELRFEQHCEGMAPALRGKLRWSSGG
jgi:hypothetical protein